jgi:undecaprenyl-diphosphatase
MLIGMTVATAAAKETVLGTSPRQWVLWLVALAGALVLTTLALFDVYPPGDVALSRVVQSVHFPGVNVVSEFVYRIGLSPYSLVIALAIALLMAWRGQRLMVLFVILAVLARTWAVLIKEIVERPRPSPLLVDVSEQAPGFSFPSSHVLGAVLMWGLVYFASEWFIDSPQARKWVRWSSLAIIVLMGLQRVYAGAHWPSDVLGAYLWGGIILFALVKGYEFCGRCRLQGAVNRVRPSGLDL